ncbi:MAG: hypothetical protein WB586_25120 [Chthoniobacterales bacterium]
MKPQKATDPLDTALDVANLRKAIGSAKKEMPNQPEASSSAEHRQPQGSPAAAPPVPARSDQEARQARQEATAAGKGQLLAKRKTTIVFHESQIGIVTEQLFEFLRKGYRPVSVNTIVLAMIQTWKPCPEMDDAVKAIIATDKRVTRGDSRSA